LESPLQLAADYGRVTGHPETICIYTQRHSIGHRAPAHEADAPALLGDFLERATGIEPVFKAWEARNKTLKAIYLAALSFPSDSLNWKLDGN